MQITKHFAYYPALISLVLLSGCVTNAKYQEAELACAAQAFQRFPQNLQTRAFSETYSVKVPTGVTTCTQQPSTLTNDHSGRIVSHGATRCVEETRTEYRERLVERVVDVNLSNRTSFTSRCVADYCIRNVGSHSCIVKLNKYKSYAGFQDKEIATQVLNRYFGTAWVADPHGQYNAIGGSVCGENGREEMPIDTINIVRVMYHDGYPHIVLERIRWHLAWGPCGQQTMSFRGDFSQNDLDQIANALITLGAKW